MRGCQHTAQKQSPPTSTVSSVVQEAEWGPRSDMGIPSRFRFTLTLLLLLPPHETDRGILGLGEDEGGRYERSISLARTYLKPCTAAGPGHGYIISKRADRRMVFGLVFTRLVPGKQAEDGSSQPMVSTRVCEWRIVLLQISLLPKSNPVVILFSTARLETRRIHREYQVYSVWYNAMSKLDHTTTAASS